MSTSRNLKISQFKSQLAKAKVLYLKGHYYSALAAVDLLFQSSEFSENKYKDILVDVFLLIAEVLYSLQQYNLALEVFTKTPEKFLRSKINECLYNISIQHKKGKASSMSFSSLGLKYFDFFILKRSQVYNV